MPFSTPSRRLLTAALAAAGQGWPVFPLRPYGKRPAIRAWPERATCDPDQLAAWWRQAPYNVGVACGPAGLLVVDLDAGPDVSGRTVFKLLCLEAGARLEPTFRVLTPSGGEHRYYTATADQPARSTAGLLGSHVDTRGRGGYVAAAGSVHRQRGRSRWYSIADPRPPAPLPSWIGQLLTPPPRPAHPPMTAVLVSAYVAAAVLGECRNVQQATLGCRNTILFRAALCLGSLAGTGALEAEDAAQRLRDAASVHCGVDGFTAGEADRTIANGLRYGQQHPRQLRSS